LSKKKLIRSIDLLRSAIARLLQLCDGAGSQSGRVGTLRKRLVRAREILDKQCQDPPLDKHRSRQTVEGVLAETVDCLIELVVLLSKES
jgi:hypothetical protein